MYQDAPADILQGLQAMLAPKEPRQMPPKRTRKLPPALPSRTLHHWLATLIDTTREAADIPRRHVAERLNVDYATVRRFEEGHTWPKEVDQYLAAYAELFDVGDPRYFYAWALELWHADTEGDIPVIERRPSPTESAEAAVRPPPRDTNGSPHAQRRTLDASANGGTDG
jgi:transcriptional regulator with XRE-family HTH domain